MRAIWTVFVVFISLSLVLSLLLPLGYLAF